MKEHLLTTEEIAEYLRVEVVTVRRLIARGDLPAYRIGSEFRFMVSDIETFVRSQRVSGSGEKAEEMSNKFTERVRKVLILANQEAQEMDHHYIGTEHLLLGILREGGGVAVIALIRSGLKYQDARQRVLDILEKGKQLVAESTRGQLKAALQEALGLGRSPDPFDERGLTKRAKKVIELAIDEARRLNHHYIGTEHLLIAIMREGEGLAAQVLIEGYGLQLKTVRELVLQILQEKPMTAPPEVPEQAATLLSADEQGIPCNTCSARNPAYFHYCFNCGTKLQM